MKVLCYIITSWRWFI